MPFPVVPLAIAAGSIIAGAIMKPRDPNFVAADVSTPAIATATEMGRSAEIGLRQRQQQAFGDISAAGLQGSAAGSALDTVFSQGNLFRSKINATIMDAVTKARTAQNIENANVANRIEEYRIQADATRRKAIFGGAANIGMMFASRGMMGGGDEGGGGLSELEKQANAALGNADIESGSYLDYLNDIPSGYQMPGGTENVGDYG